MANTHSLSLVAASSQYASIGDTASLSINGTTLTIEAWVKMTSTTVGGYPVGKWHDENLGRSYSIFMQASPLIFHLEKSTTGSNNGSSNNNNTSLSEGIWTHIAFTLSDTTSIAYVNGVADGGGNSTLPAGSIYDSTRNFMIGAKNSQAPDNFFGGLIDEVRVWNVVRTATEIANNYQTELVGNESGLVAYYKLNNNYNDTTANANNLTASGSPIFSIDVPFGSVATNATSDFMTTNSKFWGG